MKNLLLILSTLTLFAAKANGTSFVSDQTKIDALIEKLTPMIQEDIQKKALMLSETPALSPLYLVYGLELDASVGVGDVLEFGKSLSLELHFKKKD